MTKNGWTIPGDVLSYMALIAVDVIDRCSNGIGDHWVVKLQRRLTLPLQLQLPNLSFSPPCRSSSQVSRWLDILVAAYYLIRGLSFSEIRNERSFDLLILVGTFVLPQLTAFPIKLLGWNPLDYSMPGLLRTGIFLGSFYWHFSIDRDLVALLHLA